MQGWQGRVLRIDLDSGRAESEALSAEVATNSIGGRGLASRSVVDESDPTVDALDPRAILAIAAGPLACTLAPAASRCQIVGKSPLTGALSCLNFGGNFGAELKRAGYDLITIRGAATEPVYLFIEQDNVAIRPASELWGKGTREVDVALRKETSEGAGIASIGPAGERMVRIATVSDGGLWSAGGAGLGAVLGSKKIKAVAVKGDSPVRVADVGGFRQAVAQAMDRIVEDPFTSTKLPAYGTGALVRKVNDRGILPTANFRTGKYASAARISGEAVADELLVRNLACFGCPIGCGRYTRVKGGTQRGTGPEFEHLWALGSNCLVDDLSAIAGAAYLCRDLGLDPVEAGCAISTAMELREKGGDVGAELRFGYGEQVVQLLQDIGLQQGFGRILGEGGYRLAREFRQPDAFFGAGQQAYAAYDPRGNEALALHYATSPSTDDHLAVGLRLWDQRDPSGLREIQGEIVAMTSSGVCPIVSAFLSSEDVARLLSAATGITYVSGDFTRIGQGIRDLEASFNAKGVVRQ